jgi:hypothetical protein
MMIRYYDWKGMLDLDIKGKEKLPDENLVRRIYPTTVVIKKSI